MGAFNLEDQLTFYGAFHNNRFNQLIHMIFVPLIVWSGMVFLIGATPGPDHAFLTLNKGSPLAALIPTNGINLALVVMLMYQVYYLTLDFSVGLAYDVFLYVLYLHATSFTSTTPSALWIAFGVHALSWWAQVHLGHGVCEKRRPALTTSFFQSLVLAPIFTFFELLFWMGFKKELAKKINRRVVANIKQFKMGLPAEKQTF